MAAPSRLYTFTSGDPILSAQANAELNQIIAALVQVGTDGVFQNFKFGSGGLFGNWTTQAGHIYSCQNCSVSGSTFTAYDTAKSAIAIDFDISNSAMAIHLKTSTASPWTSWDKTFMIIDSAGLIEIIDLKISGTVGIAMANAEADKIIHKITTKTRTYNHTRVASATTNGVVRANGSSILTPGASDGTKAWGDIDLDIPVGATITGLKLFGTAVSSYEHIEAALYTRASSTGTATLQATAALNNTTTYSSDTQAFSKALASGESAYVVLSQWANSGGDKDDCMFKCIEVTTTTVNAKMTL